LKDVKRRLERGLLTIGVRDPDQEVTALQIESRDKIGSFQFVIYAWHRTLVFAHMGIESMHISWDFL
jgi:hypothetical protein